jgi:hypothetical protein
MQGTCIVVTRPTALALMQEYCYRLTVAFNVALI